MLEDTASALFGVEGLQITGVQAGPGGALEVWAVTDYPAAAACPECGTVSGRVHETVLARPRDVRRAGDPVDVRWVKYRRKCGNRECPRKTFTEPVPALPPRCRITARLREQAAHEITERGIASAEDGVWRPTAGSGLRCCPSARSRSTIGLNCGSSSQPSYSPSSRDANWHTAIASRRPPGCSTRRASLRACRRSAPSVRWYSGPNSNTASCDWSGSAPVRVVAAAAGPATPST